MHTNLHKMHMVCMHNFYTQIYGLVFAHTGSHIFVWTCVCPQACAHIHKVFMHVDLHMHVHISFHIHAADL